MVRVSPINLAYNPKTLWFDPGDIDVRKNDPVIVDTARGREFGRAVDDIIEVSEQAIEDLKTPLKSVLRIATPEDIERAAELEAQGREALPIFKALAAESNEDMHPVSVEFLFDGDKAIFYFEAEERIDFRDLVRKLAAHFRVRIDMRQIGVRDEARIIGGLGHCGQELCCKRLGGEFCPVSIRMAKEQDLSLNPQKISGLCGRLMCCLRYEYDAYRDFKSRAPKLNATIETPAGDAKVIELDVPREVIKLQVEEEKPVKVPLSEFDTPPEGTKPHRVGQEAWDEATQEIPSGYQGESLSFLASKFTGSDKLAEAGSLRSINNGKTLEGGPSTEKAAKTPGRKLRSRRVAGSATEQKASEGRQQAASPKPRRRRSTSINTDAVDETVQESASRRPVQRRENNRRQGGSRQDSPRARRQSQSSSQSQSQSQGHYQGQGHSQSQGLNQGQGQSHGQGQVQGKPATKTSAPRPRPEANNAGTGESLRPGHRSSGLRSTLNREASESSPKQEQTHRRPRRRSHKAQAGESGSSPTNPSNSR